MLKKIYDETMVEWNVDRPALYLFVDFSSVDSGVRYLREAGRGMCLVATMTDRCTCLLHCHATVA